MSTVSVRIDEGLWKKVQRKTKKSRNTMINYINSAIEEKLERDRASKNIGKGDIPLPQDYKAIKTVFVDPFGGEHQLK